MNAALVYNWWYRGQTQQEIVLTGLTACRGYGDSIMAAPSISAAQRFINLFVSGKNLTLSNQAVSGYSARNAAALASSQTLNPGTTLNVIQVGLNTISQVAGDENPGQFEQTFSTEIEAAFKHILTRGSIKGTEVAGGNAAVTRVGTISGYAAGGGNGATFGTGTLPGQFATISSGVASWTWTCPGTAFAVAMIARATHGTGNIQVNGNTVLSFDLKRWYSGNLVGPLSYMFRGIPAGATITVNASGDAPVAVDYFTEIKDPLAALITDRPASFLFADIPFCTTAGYASLAGGLGSRAKSIIASQVIESITNAHRAIGYNIARVQTNAYGYDPVNTSDGAHPDVTGHAQLVIPYNAAV